MYIQVNLKDILIPACPEGTELRHERMNNVDTQKIAAEELRHLCWLSDPGQYATSLPLSSLICLKGS